MRISEAKIKNYAHTHTKNNNICSHTRQTSPNKTSHSAVCLRAVRYPSPLGRSTLKQKPSHIHAPATRSKYRQRWKDKNQELSLSAKHTVQRESGQRKAKAPIPEYAQPQHRTMHFPPIANCDMNGHQIHFLLPLLKFFGTIGRHTANKTPMKESTDQKSERKFDRNMNETKRELFVFLNLIEESTTRYSTIMKQLN